MAGTMILFAIIKCFSAFQLVFACLPQAIPAAK
jgi:hypothetical protein